MEKRAPRSFSWQFKEEVAKRMLNGESPTLLSRELSIVLSKLYKWRDQYRLGGTGLWPRAAERLGSAMPGGERLLRLPGRFQHKAQVDGGHVQVGP